MFKVVKNSLGREAWVVVFYLGVPIWLPGNEQLSCEIARNIV